MLSEQERTNLENAIENYDFPCVVYDFVGQAEIKFEAMDEVENTVFDQITSGNIQTLKDGLSNVLYWGHATAGYRDTRVNNFRENVTEAELYGARALFDATRCPTLTELKNLGMPEFSGMSFISKIRMFLSPNQSATLDKQIIKMKFTEHGVRTVLNELSHREGETQIRISANNSAAYELWCNRLRNISQQYYGNAYRVADVERGLFKIIRDGNPIYAAQILANA